VPEQFSGWRRAQGVEQAWKIVFFHHPLYSSGDRHSSDLRLRDVVEPMFVNQRQRRPHRARSFYERVKPQQRIHYFVTGSGDSCGRGTSTRTGITAQGFDTDLVFMAAEIAGDDTCISSGHRPLMAYAGGFRGREAPHRGR
jgi:hypothetical protein